MVSRWLIEKAVARLRSDKSVAQVLSLHISVMGHKSWGRSMRSTATQDTQELIRMNRGPWREAWPAIRGAKLVGIEVHLGYVDYLAARTGDPLFPVGATEHT